MAKEQNINLLVLKPGHDVEEVTIENELDPLKGLLDDGYLEMVRLNSPVPGELTMIVDEEGMMKDLEPSLAWEGGTIVGNIVFAGMDVAEGEFISLSDEQKAYVKEWLVGRQIN